MSLVVTNTLLLPLVIVCLLATVYNASVAVPDLPRRTVACLVFGIIILAMVFADAAVLSFVPAGVRAAVGVTATSNESIFSFSGLEVIGVIWIRESVDRAQGEQRCKENPLQ